MEVDLKECAGENKCECRHKEYYDQNELARSREAAPATHCYQEVVDKAKTRSRSGKNQTRKDSPIEDSPNEDKECEKTRSKEKLQAEVIDLESKMDRLLKLMEQQKSAKN